MEEKNKITGRFLHEYMGMDFSWFFLVFYIGSPVFLLLEDFLEKKY
jgi:hypothetical protein